MFTGIVQEIGLVSHKEETDAGITLQINTSSRFLKDLNIGASIAVNGVCLTVINFSKNKVSFDVIPETLRVTNLKFISKGSEVNLERSLKFGDEIGGHILSGHIMATGIIHSRVESGDQMTFSILASPSTHKYLTEKGYIAIDGISLTVGEVENGIFHLHIIPETLRLTTLGSKQIGDVVNLEIDSNTQLIVETIERLMKDRGVE